MLTASSDTWGNLLTTENRYVDRHDIILIRDLLFKTYVDFFHFKKVFIALLIETLVNELLILHMVYLLSIKTGSNKH